MASFVNILDAIKTATQIAQATEPDVELFSKNHEAGTIALIQDAAASVASLDNNPATQSQAVETAQVAVSLVPTFFAFWGLFHKNKGAAVLLTSPAGAQALVPPTMLGEIPAPTVHGDVPVAPVK